MNAFWDYFWPVIAFGLAIGAIAGAVWLRRTRPWALVAGAGVALAGVGLWHFPLGAADRFVSAVEPPARAVLVDWEMGHVEGRLVRSPLTRRLILSGQADDFQREQLALMMSTLPGVSSATWSRENRGVPLLLESAAAAMAGFLLGLLLAYVVELRRRHNAQWKW